MANGRNPGRKRVDNSRDAGGFVALPWSVLDSAAYIGLSPMAKALLIEVARQYHRDDNGRMLLSRAHLAKRGWFSASFIHRAKHELLAAGLIFETVQGARPNRASWYAVTWRALDRIPGYDIGTEAAFERGAYRKTLPKAKRAPPTAPMEAAKRRKNATLAPGAGTRHLSIAPDPGTESVPPAPVPGTIGPPLSVLSAPGTGHPLDLPISAVHEVPPPAMRTRRKRSRKPTKRIELSPRDKTRLRKLDERRQLRNNDRTAKPEAAGRRIRNIEGDRKCFQRKLPAMSGESAVRLRRRKRRAAT
jgi:hypothetical protein